MKISRRLVFGALAGLLAVAGCGREKYDLTLRYWGGTDEVAAMESLVRDFEQMHPGIRVRVQRKLADHTFIDALLSDSLAGAAPDVFCVSTNDFSVLSQAGICQNLAGFVENDPSIKMGDYYPAIRKAFETKKRILALPRDISPMAVVYYNKHLFDLAHEPYPKDSWNWAEFRRLAKRLTRRDKAGQPLQFGYSEEWPMVESWMLANGGSMVDDPVHPKRFTADRPKALQAMHFRFEIQNLDRSVTTMADQRSVSGASDGLFLQGKLAMYYSGLWKTPAFRKIKNFDWDVVMFPKGPTGKRGFTSGGSGFAMSNKSRQKALAWELIRYLCGPDGETRMAAIGLSQPALKPLAKSAVFLDGQKPANKAMLIQAAEIGTLTPQAPFYQEFIANVWGPVIDPLWLPDAKESDVDPTVRKAVKLGQAYFKKRGKKH